MKEYLHLFETTEDHDREYDGSGYTEPWVAYIQESEGVTYNKAPGYLLKDIIGDLAMYDLDGMMVLYDFDCGQKAFVLNTETDEYATAEGYLDYVTESGITCDAAVATSIELNPGEAINVPSDAEYLMLSSVEAEGEGSPFVFEGGRTFSTGKTYNLTSQKTNDTLYAYDLKNNVKHTINRSLVWAGERKPDITTFYPRENTVTQREITRKDIYPPISLDNLQHATQLSDNASKFDGIMGGTTNCMLNHDNKLIFAGVAAIECTKFTDYVTIDGLDIDDVNHIQTLRLSTTKPLLRENTDIDTGTIRNLFEDRNLVKNTDYTFNLYVDDDLIRSESFRFDGSYSYYLGVRIERDMGEWSFSVDMSFR